MEKLYVGTQSNPGERTLLFVSKEDRARFDALPKGPSDEAVSVTDSTGKKYMVKRASCGLPNCFCAADFAAKHPKPQRQYGLSVPDLDEVLECHGEVCGTGCGSTEYVFNTKVMRDRAAKKIAKSLRDLARNFDRGTQNCDFDDEEEN